MGELVDQGEFRPAVEHGLDVELLEGRASVCSTTRRDHLQIRDLSGRCRSPVALPVGENDVEAAAALGARFAQHHIGLAYSWCDPKVRAKTALLGVRAHRAVVYRPGNAAPAWLGFGAFPPVAIGPPLCDLKT